jgi:hypothetical protein
MHLVFEKPAKKNDESNTRPFHGGHPDFSERLTQFSFFSNPQNRAISSKKLSDYWASGVFFDKSFPPAQPIFSIKAMSEDIATEELATLHKKQDSFVPVTADESLKTVKEAVFSEDDIIITLNRLTIRIPEDETENLELAFINDADSHGSFSEESDRSSGCIPR